MAPSLSRGGHKEFGEGAELLALVWRAYGTQATDWRWPINVRSYPKRPNCSRQVWTKRIFMQRSTFQRSAAK